MNCEEFRRLLLQHCEYKLTGHGETLEILINMEKDFDMDNLSIDHDLTTLNLRLVFEETTRDRLDMGRVFSLVIFVGLVCKQRGSTEAAYDFVNWVVDN